MDLETLKTFVQAELDKATKKANKHTDKVLELQKQMDMPCNQSNQWVVELFLHKEELREHFALGITQGLVNVLSFLDKEVNN